jgi:hypothetical protein
MKINHKHYKEKGKIRPLDPGWLACFSLLSAVAGQIFIFYLKNVPAGSLFYIIAITLFIMADRANGASTDGKNDFFPLSVKMSLRTEAVIFSFILLIAGFLRLYCINTIPGGCYYDEALGGISAIDILNGKPLPIYISNDNGISTAVFNGFSAVTNMSVYYMAAIFNYFGAGAVQMRVASSITGILAVPAIYFLIRYIGGPAPAILGAFILAIMRWHFNFSRVAFNSVEAVLMAVFVLYFAVRVYYEKKAVDFILLGAVAAASLYSYQNTRLIPLWLAVFTAYAVITNKNFFENNKKKVIAGAVACVLVFFPLWIYMTKNYDKYTERQNQVSVFSDESRIILSPDKRQSIEDNRAIMKVILDNARETLLMFNYKGDANDRHNLPDWPELDFFMGAFAVVGFGYALSRMRNPVYFLFVSAFFIFISVGFFTIGAPQSLRTTLVIPSVVFFILVFIGKFLSFLKNGKKPFYAGAVIVAMALVFACCENYYTYFIRQARDWRCYEDFSTTEYLAGEKAKEAARAGMKVVVSPRFKYHPSFIFADGLSQDTGTFDLASCFKVGNDDDRNTMLILPVQYKPFADYLTELDPGITEQYETDKYNNAPLFIYCAIPGGDLVIFDKKTADSGARAEYFSGHNLTGGCVRQKVPLIMLTAFENPGFDILSASWSGGLTAPVTGEYYFSVRTKGGTYLYVDNKRILYLSGQADAGDSFDGARIFLSKGRHLINVKYESVVSGVYGAGGMWLLWQKPGDKEISFITGTNLTQK